MFGVSYKGNFSEEMETWPTERKKSLFCKLENPIFYKLNGMLLLNLIYLFMAFFTYNRGFDNEMGVDLTNSWMMYKNYLPCLDFIDTRGALLGNYFFSLVFKFFGVSYLYFRLTVLTLGLVSANVWYYLLSLRMKPIWTCVAVLTGFAYLLGSIPANPSHLFHPIIAPFVILSWIYFTSKGKNTISFFILGCFLGFSYLFEMSGISNSIHFCLLVFVMIKSNDMISVLKNILWFHAGFFAVLGFSVLVLLFSGQDVKLFLNILFERMSRMSNTAIVMESDSLFSPVTTFKRHMSHWLGSFIGNIQHYGLFSFKTISHALYNYYYFWLGTIEIIIGFILMISWCIKERTLFFLSGSNLFKDCMVLIWCYMTGSWSIELLRGAPFINHTPQYAMIITGICFVFFLQYSLNWVKQHAAQYNKYFSLFLLLLFVASFGIFSLQVSIKGWEKLGGKSLYLAGSPVLKGMRLTEKEKQFYDEPVQYIVERTAEDEYVLNLGYDTNFNFFCNRLSPVFENTNFVMFWDKPLKNYDTKAALEKALEKGNAKYIIVPIYKEHPHSMENEIFARGAVEGLPQNVLKIMSANAKKYFMQKYTLSEFQIDRQFNYNDPHVHIYNRKDLVIEKTIFLY